MHHAAVMIAKDLDFNVTRVFNIFFYQQSTVAEGAFCFSAGGSKSLFKFCGVAHNAHAASTAAHRGFDQLGKFIFRRSRNYRHASFLRQLARSAL